MKLERAFREILEDRSVPSAIADGLWDEIVKAHSDAGRHYHDLQHLEQVYRQLEPHKAHIQDRTALIIALAYHDIIQSVLRKDDEERSAELMRLRMKGNGISSTTIDRAADHIMATREHRASLDPDTDLFTDADLSILGSDRIEYAIYADRIRKEYALVPDLLYRPGRKKVLQQLLDLPKIFKSPAFRPLEAMARTNLQWEIGRL